MSTNASRISTIQSLFTLSDSQSLPLWLESGWAIDARLGHITREHEDIDVAYPLERHEDYLAILHNLGFDRYKAMDYGFLMWQGDVLLDSEPCERLNGEYNFARFPPGSCPDEKQGLIDGYPLRCLSWEAIYYEFIGYLDEVPKTRWREKDLTGFNIVESRLEAASREALKALYNSNQRNVQP
jgi:2''-aminoglycoside nucleotidyltransferase